MNKIISENINWERLSKRAKGELSCEITDAYISKTTGLLTVKMGLNFVMPPEDERRLKLAILSSIPGAGGVDIEYEYAKEMAVPVLEEKKPEKPPAPAKAKKPSESSAGGGENGSFRKGRRRRDSKITGKEITGSPKRIDDLQPDDGEVVICGTIFHKEDRPISDEKKIMTIYVTDRTNSVAAKAFLKNDYFDEVNGEFKKGDYVILKGRTEWDRYEEALTLTISAIQKSKEPERIDTFEGGKRVELHCHTVMSAMDGFNDPKKLVKTAAKWGQPAVAITDHGVVQAFPDAAKAAKDLAKEGVDIKVIYGMEGYVFDDSDCMNEDGSIDYKKNPTYHIILLARTQEGMKNLYKLVSLSHLNYFYKRPRLPKSVIQSHREGLIIGSACEAGEVYRAIFHEKSEEEIERIASFYDYLEIQPLINNRFMVERSMVKDNEALKDINRRIIALADKMGKPVVATTDAHYDEPESAIYRNIVMKGMGFQDAENGQGLYLRTTNEMMDEFSYLGEKDAFRVVVENTNLIAGMIEDGIKPVPSGKYPPKIEGAEETLRNTCMQRAHEIYGDPLPKEIADRLEVELSSIIDNGYAVMYVSAQMLVKKSLDDGYLVGSRGSVGSSFAATMAGITEVNPLDPHYLCPKCKHLEWGDRKEYDCGIDMPEKDCPVCGTPMKRDGFAIPFATFLGFTGNKEPDIDLNFAGEYQAQAHKYVGVIFGEENVFKAGTVSAIQDKTAYGYVRKFFEETGRVVNKFEIQRLVDGCVGIKRTTGQHPGGIIIVPSDHEIYEFCPVQHPANDTRSDIITTHFDYHKIDENLLKLDILGHTVPSMIRQLQDMTGVDPLKVDLTDRKVLSIFNGIEALEIKDPDYRFTHGSFAIPEFGTNFVRGMLDDVKPGRFEDLVRMSGFSHGTNVWLNNAQEFIRSGQATMREAISTRDDIMNYLILKGVPNSDAFNIMEKVRKGKGVAPDYEELMKEHDVPDWYIESCKRISYMFPRAHAVAYTVMSFRMAWFKVYYPAEFYATYFSSVIADFNADVIMLGPEACISRMEEIKTQGKFATAKEKDEMTVLEVAYEMYARGFGFEHARLGESRATKFWVEDGKVLLPYAAYKGVGENAARSIAEAYEERPFETVEDCMKRAGASRAVIDTLRQIGLFEGLPETEQLSWDLLIG